MKKRILFIVNPISGVGKQQLVESAVDTELDNELFDVQFSYTEYAGHATEIADKASNHYDSVIAVGGDGTVNEVASGLLHSDCSLGIIPTGSGNGFARHCNIPLQVTEAVRMLNSAQVLRIDTANLNGRCFVNVSGVGFDAEVGHQFADHGTRGAMSYVKISALSYWKYKPAQYKLEIDGKAINTNAFTISFANTSQFGNNAHIAPLASIQDGLLDVSIIRRFPKLNAGNLAVKLFNKRLHHSRYYENFKCQSVVLFNDKPLKIHIDGEPEIVETNIAINIKPASLSVLCPAGQVLKIK